MIIETERLILRPFTESDAADVLEYLREPAVNCFASMKLNSLDEAEAEMKNRYRYFNNQQYRKEQADESIVISRQRF